VAKRIYQAFGPKWIERFARVDQVEPSELSQYDFIIAGTPTYEEGDMQEAWERFAKQLEGVDLSGTRVAVFALGDQLGFPDLFCGALLKLYNTLTACGAQGGFGFQKPEGYDFEGTCAMIDGKFCGLALDEENQPGRTDERIDRWCQQLHAELGDLAKAGEQAGG
jgi:flavodoxin I